MVPLAARLADSKPGGVRSVDELLVTATAEKDSASLPAMSCTAAFVVAGSGDGAVYASVTVEPAPIGSESAKIKFVPEIETDDTVCGVPSTVRVKLTELAAVPPKVSS